MNGQIQVEQATGADVEVRAERVVKASSDQAAKELLAKVEMVETKTADGVKLETRAPKHFGRGGVEVKYFVKVPAGLKVSAQTTNGGIRLLNISNEIVASTTNGGVSGRRPHRRRGGDDDQWRHRPVARRGGPGRREGRDGQRRRRRVVAARCQGRRARQRASTAASASRTCQSRRIGEQNRRRLEGKLNGGGPSIVIGAVNGGVRLAGK